MTITLIFWDSQLKNKKIVYTLQLNFDDNSFDLVYSITTLGKQYKSMAGQMIGGNIKPLKNIR
jgi:hypothetical protein